MMSKTDKGAVNSRVEDETAGFVMPSDYQLVTPIEGEQLWWKPEPGAVVSGRILGRFPRKDDTDGAFYQIRVSKFQGQDTGVKAITGKGDAAKTVNVRPGQVINMDERSSLANLRPLAESDGVFDMLLHVLEKTKISGGRTFWRMSCGSKCIKAPSTPITKQGSSRTDDMGASY